MMTYFRNAWHQERDLPCTEAKRRYITTLIDVMRRNASHNHEAQNLIAELEELWDPVANAAPSPPASSPGAFQLNTSQDEDEDESDDFGIGRANWSSAGSRLRVVSPRNIRQERLISNRDTDGREIEADEDDDDDDDDEEFQEARNTLDTEEAPQINHDNEKDSLERLGERRSLMRDRAWRRRVGNSLNQISTELAALREQMQESRRRHHRQRENFFKWVRILGWPVLKHFIWDLFALLCLLVCMRLRGDRRLERWIRAIWTPTGQRLMPWTRRCTSGSQQGPPR